MDSVLDILTWFITALTYFGFIATALALAAAFVAWISGYGR